MKKCKDCAKRAECTQVEAHEYIEQLVDAGVLPDIDDEPHQEREYQHRSDELVDLIQSTATLAKVTREPMFIDMMLMMIGDLIDAIVEELHAEELNAMAQRALNCIRKVVAIMDAYHPKFGDGKVLHDELDKVLFAYAEETKNARVDS